MTPEPPVSLWPDPDSLGTITDLYELTMMAGYLASGMADKPATFEIFVRRLPTNRSFLVFAGLEQAVGDLMRLAFSAEQVEALREWPSFREQPSSFFETLRATAVHGRRLGRARGDRRVSRRDAGPGRRRRWPRRSGSRPSCWPRSAIRRSWRPRRPGW